MRLPLGTGKRNVPYFRLLEEEDPVDLMKELSLGKPFFRGNNSPTENMNWAGRLEEDEWRETPIIRRVADTGFLRV